MTNNATRANAQAMSANITRRTALVGTAFLTAPPVTAALAEAGSSLDELNRLIDAHAQAMVVDREKWNHASDADDAIAGKLPICRVQVAKRLGPNDADGNETWTPIYAHSDEEIDRTYCQRLDTSLNWWGNNGEAVARIREKHDQRVSQKKAELAALEAERKRIEDESGHTAMLDAARASSSAVRAIEAAIVALVPDTLEAAIRKAAWIVNAYVEDDDAYLYDEGEDALIAALKAIGEARI